MPARTARNKRAAGIGRRGIPSALIVVSCAATIAACGSHGPTNSAGNGLVGQGKYAGALSFAACMRSHAVPNFPDPKVTGNSIQIPGSGPGVNRQSPAFESAQAACKHLLPGGGSPSQHQITQAMAQLLRVSQCMRAHGTSGFPDPTATSLPPNRAGHSDIIGHDGVFLAIPNSINISSPAFKQTAAGCNLRLPAG